MYASVICVSLQLIWTDTSGQQKRTEKWNASVCRRSSYAYLFIDHWSEECACIGVGNALKIYKINLILKSHSKRFSFEFFFQYDWYRNIILYCVCVCAKCVPIHSCNWNENPNGVWKQLNSFCYAHDSIAVKKYFEHTKGVRFAVLYWKGTLDRIIWINFY